MAAKDRNGGELRRLRARASALEQLLDVYERSVLEQADKLYDEREQLRLHTTLLASQGEASLDGILSVSMQGRVLFRNRRFGEMWGLPSPAVGEPSWDQTVRAMAERSADPGEVLRRVASVGDDEEGRDEVRLADGRTFDRYTAPIRSRGGGSRDGALLGRVWHFRDITAVKEVARMKDEFISAVSHELRTPLTSIRGSLDLIAAGVMGDLSCEAASLVKVARDNCQRLGRLIDDVLDIGKIESGQVAPQLRPLRLESLVEKSVASMRPYGRELGVGFAVESQIPGARVRGDADQLIRVMENLLSNAAKFSPRGETVRIRLSRRGPLLRVAVVDRGPGIAAEARGRLFEKFSQLGGPRGARRPGTGLGLNLARAIVEQHGGAIDFASEPGAGSTFYFDLPECDLPECDLPECDLPESDLPEVP